MIPAWLLRALATVLRRIPVAWKPWRAVAWAAMQIAPGRLRIATANLEAAFGEASPTDARRVVAHLAQTAWDFLRLPEHRKNGFRAVRVANIAPLQQALGDGGAILATGHLGSWELALAALAQHADGPLAVVVKRLGWLDGWVDDERRRSGLETIQVDHPSATLRRALTALAAGKGVVMVIDQHAPGGRVGPFFGRLAATTDVPVRLAVRRQRPLLWLNSWREAGDRHRIEVETVWTPGEAGDAAELVARLNARLEDAIRRHPSQWLWTHRRWKVKTPAAAPPDAER
ncbi:MAG: lysophospholipid acyltransferase family protein [Myxococcota bacterium]